MSSKPLLFRLAHPVRFVARLVACMLLCPTMARAQGVDEFGSFGPPPNADTRWSPHNFSLELRFGPYLPRVDSEFTNGKKPFERYFGTKNRVAVGAEFDWLLLKIDRVLRVGPGIGVMYTSIGADAFFDKFPDTRAPGQRTSLRILPHWATAVLHLDALAQRTPIPIVFTAKAGLAHALWWVKDVPHTVPAADGTVGRGRSYGAYYALGAQLDLGFLDTTRKKRLDSFTGINSIYLFGEFYALELNGFGASGVMNVGDRSWVLGLALDL
jgi:hypothetical protein